MVTIRMVMMHFAFNMSFHVGKFGTNGLHQMRPDVVFGYVLNRSARPNVLFCSMLRALWLGYHFPEAPPPPDDPPPKLDLEEDEDLLRREIL